MTTKAYKLGISSSSRARLTLCWCYPLTYGDSLTLEGIMSSATKEKARLEKLMATKTRKNTQVYSDLQRQLTKMNNILGVA